MNPFEKMLPPVIMGADEPLSKGIRELEKAKTCVVITRGKEYCGILDDRSIEKMRSDPMTTKIGAVVETAPLIPNGASLMEVCKLFFAGPYKSLPVQEGEKVIGVITRTQVIESLLSMGVLEGKVHEFMNAPAVTIVETATLAQARAKMREMNVRRLIVCNEKGGISGLVSTYDLKKAVPKQKAPFVHDKYSTDNPPVASAMSEEVVAIQPGASLSEAAQKMVESGVASLVVMEGQKPIGLLSARDLFESIMFKEKAPVYISGLDNEGRQFAEEITSDCEKEVERLGKSFDLEYLALHFKRYGRKHSIHARLKTNQFGIISASNHGFDMQGALHGVLSELRKMLMDQKIDPMHEKRRKPFRGL